MCANFGDSRSRDQELRPVFPLGHFFSANQRFVGARANNFWQYGKLALENSPN